MDLNPDFRWVLDGDFTDEMGNLDGTGSEPPVYVNTIIPYSDHAQCGDFTPYDEMHVANDPLINTGTGYLGQQRSISLWFNADTIPTNAGNTIWSQGGGTNSITIYTYNSSGTTFVYCAAVEGANIDYVRAEITTGETYHLVVTYDFPGNVINLYINGSLVDTDNSLAVGPSLASHSGNIALGGQDTNTDNHLGQSISNNFDGRIADLAYWSDGGVLSSTNVSDIYLAGTTELAWNEYNVDTASPWSWEFDFPNGTGYYQFCSIGKKSGSPDEIIPDTPDAICIYNRIPTITNEGPTNESIDIPVYPQLNITVNDLDGDTLNVTWYSNSSGTWQAFGTNNSISNGTYHQNNSNFSLYYTTFWWYVTVSDGFNTNTSETFHFTTEHSTLIDIIPAQWDIGSTTIGNYNYSTSGFYFNLTNNGTISLDIQIKASNATNTSTGAQWNLSSTPGFDNYSLQYNKSLVGPWININQTYDTFISNLGIGSWQTFDLNIFMATTSTKSDPLSVTITFRSVIS